MGVKGLEDKSPKIVPVDRINIKRSNFIYLSTILRCLVRLRVNLSDHKSDREVTKPFRKFAEVRRMSSCGPFENFGYCTIVTYICFLNVK